MGKIKIKHREPKRTEFTPNDIVIDVKNGRLFYKSNFDTFKVVGINITSAQTSSGTTGIAEEQLEQINAAIADGDNVLAASLNTEAILNQQQAAAISTLQGQVANNLNLNDAGTNEVLFNNGGDIDGDSTFKFLPDSGILELPITNANNALTLLDTFTLKNDSTPTPTFDNSVGAGTQTPGITLGGEEVSESSTSPGSFSGGSLKLQTPFGNLKIGPRNTSYCHFYTNRSKYYFNKKVVVDEGEISSYNESLKLMVSSFSTDRSHIVIKNTSTDCSVEVHGDIIAKPQGDNFGKIMAENDVVAFASDKRLKENIVEISNPLDKIQQVRGVYFDWNQKSKEEGFKAAREKNEIGMIAQEVEQIIPQAIEPAPFNKEYKTIKYDRLIPLLVECIKDQQKQIDELKSKL
jgi:hypothetical protein